jgi:TonB family protein
MKRVRLHVSSRSSNDKASGADANPFEGFLGTAFDEKPIWAGIYENFRDVLFPHKFPPLELTSTPVPTPDRMAVKTNPWAIGTATLANGGVVVLLILLGFRTTINHFPAPAADGNIHLKDFTLFAPPRDSAAGGGGGGGSNELTDPIVGRTPKQENMPLAPLQPPVLEHPTIAVDPAIAVPLEIKLPDNPQLPNIGVHKSTNVTLDSTGPGTRAGIGTGSDGGDGPGKGIGYGPGFDRGIGNSIYRPGTGGVTNPVPLVTPEAEFSDEARRSKYQGVCMISIVVDAQGYPRNPRVLRSLGMGLDEKALEAVQRYRFKPAMKDGKPVASMISVEVNFRLY